MFTPYSTASDRRRTSLAVVIARTAAGNVPPIKNVGNPNTTAASSRRTTVAAASPNDSCPPKRKYIAATRPTKNGLTATESDTAISSQPYIRNGLAARSARRPNTALPTHSPPMKIASTAATAAVVAPNTKRNSRIQAT